MLFLFFVPSLNILLSFCLENSPSSWATPSHASGVLWDTPSCRKPTLSPPQVSEATLLTFAPGLPPSRPCVLRHVAPQANPLPKEQAGAAWNRDLS